MAVADFDTNMSQNDITSYKPYTQELSDMNRSYFNRHTIHILAFQPNSIG